MGSSSGEPMPPGFPLPVTSGPHEPEAGERFGLSEPRGLGLMQGAAHPSSPRPTPLCDGEDTCTQVTLSCLTPQPHSPPDSVRGSQHSASPASQLEGGTSSESQQVALTSSLELRACLRLHFRSSDICATGGAVGLLDGSTHGSWQCCSALHRETSYMVLLPRHPQTPLVHRAECCPPEADLRSQLPR